MVRFAIAIVVCRHWPVRLRGVAPCNHIRGVASGLLDKELGCAWPENGIVRFAVAVKIRSKRGKPRLVIKHRHHNPVCLHFVVGGVYDRRGGAPRACNTANVMGDGDLLHTFLDCVVVRRHGHYLRCGVVGRRKGECDGAGGSGSARGYKCNVMGDAIIGARWYILPQVHPITDGH